MEPKRCSWTTKAEGTQDKTTVDCLTLSAESSGLPSWSNAEANTDGESDGEDEETVTVRPQFASGAEFWDAVSQSEGNWIQWESGHIDHESEEFSVKVQGVDEQARREAIEDYIGGIIKVFEFDASEFAGQHERPSFKTPGYKVLSEYRTDSHGFVRESDYTPDSEEEAVAHVPRKTIERFVLTKCSNVEEEAADAEAEDAEDCQEIGSVEGKDIVELPADEESGGVRIVSTAKLGANTPDGALEFNDFNRPPTRPHVVDDDEDADANHGQSPNPHNRRTYGERVRSTASRFKQNLNTFSDSVRSKVRGIFRPRRDANGWIAPARTVDGLNEETDLFMQEVMAVDQRNPVDVDKTWGGSKVNAKFAAKLSYPDLGSITVADFASFAAIKAEASSSLKLKAWSKSYTVYDFLVEAHTSQSEGTFNPGYHFKSELLNCCATQCNKSNPSKRYWCKEQSKNLLAEAVQSPFKTSGCGTYMEIGQSKVTMFQKDNMRLFKASTAFIVYGVRIPVTISGSGDITLSFDVSMCPDMAKAGEISMRDLAKGENTFTEAIAALLDSFVLQTEIELKIRIAGSVGIDLYLLEVGASVSVTALDTRLQLNGNLRPFETTVCGGTSNNQKLKSLAGNVGVYYDPVWGSRKSKQLFDWNPAINKTFQGKCAGCLTYKNRGLHMCKSQSSSQCSAANWNETRNTCPSACNFFDLIKGSCRN